MSDAEIDEAATDDAPKRVPKRVQRVMCIAGSACYAIALLIIGLMFSVTNPPDVTTVAVVFLGIGTLLLFPWDYLDFTKVKVGSVEFERAVTEQEGARAQLEKRVSDLERHLADLASADALPLAGEDEVPIGEPRSAWAGEYKKLQEERKERTRAMLALMEKRKGRFMNITRIRAYSEADGSTPLIGLGIAALREAATQLVADGNLEVKISARSGSRLYRWKQGRSGS